VTYGENLTKRWDPNNIIDYLHNLNKNCSRQTKHSNIQFKKRKLFFKNVCKLLNEKTPVKIEQQKIRNFPLSMIMMINLIFVL